jgi:hypothetical protein
VDNGRSAAISLEVPVFSAWLAAEAGDVGAVLSSALELKTTQTFQDIRGMLREVRVAYDEDGLAEANKRVRKWQKELEKASRNLKGRYGLDSGQGVQVSYLVRVYNAVASLAGLPQFPEFDFKIPLPDFLRAGKSRSFSNVYKDIAGELTSVERLGGIRDLMASRFVIDDKDYVPPKTEAPQFRRKASDWKIPM